MPSEENQAATSGWNGPGNGPIGSGDPAPVQAECERLAERVRQLEKERDAYRQALYAYELERITDADLQQYARHENGVPLEAFLEELKGTVEGKSS
jgi:hypothetical protein